MDSITKEMRSANMRAIHSKDTKPEVYLRKLLFAVGLRYSLYSSKVPGKPDLYLRKYNTAVFVNGCFWHHHAGCRYGYIPKSNQEYWTGKFERNRKRDQKVASDLRKKHVRQIVIWECLIHKMKKNDELANQVIETILAFLHSDHPFLELADPFDPDALPIKSMQSENGETEG